MKTNNTLNMLIILQMTTRGFKYVRTVITTGFNQQHFRERGMAKTTWGRNIGGEKNIKTGVALIYLNVYIENFSPFLRFDQKYTDLCIISYEDTS
jgi:hypothetical protein